MEIPETLCILTILMMRIIAELGIITTDSLRTEVISRKKITKKNPDTSLKYPDSDPNNNAP